MRKGGPIKSAEVTNLNDHRDLSPLQVHFETFCHKLHSVSVTMRLGDIRGSLAGAHKAEKRGDESRAQYLKVMARRQLRALREEIGMDELERELRG